MSWLYSQALVEEYLGANCLDGEQSALLSGNHTQQAYCAPDKMTDFSRPSRFGMTFKPLTESLGEELLTSYLAGFHAKTSQPQEKEKGLRESDQECGRTWQELLARYDRDMSLWRTPQCLLDEDSAQSLETWPAWGMTRNGESYPRQTLEPNICEREYGLSPDNVNFFHTPTTGTSGGSNSRKAMTKRNVTWPTPTTPSGGGNAGGSGAQKNAIKNGTYVPSSINPNLYEWLMGWPQEWTDLKPLAMDKCRKWQLLHGEFLAKD
jgi:hypothetical protein